MNKFINLIQKETKRSDAYATEYWVSNNAPESITLKRVYTNGVETELVTFVIGDSVEYDSYNLRYIGKISKISPKSITIEFSSGSKRLNLIEFSWRNYDFDLEKVRASNFETSQSI